MAGAKCSDEVDFPMELDMTPFVEESPNPLYNCVAFCSHSGKSSTSGHYTACSNRGAAGWFRFEDSTRPVHVERTGSISTGLQKELQNDMKNAYLIFYVRR
jgi:hypothetical protein